MFAKINVKLAVNIYDIRRATAWLRAIRANNCGLNCAGSGNDQQIIQGKAVEYPVGRWGAQQGYFDRPSTLDLVTPYGADHGDFPDGWESRTSNYDSWLFPKRQDITGKTYILSKYVRPYDPTCNTIDICWIVSAEHLHPLLGLRPPFSTKKQFDHFAVYHEQLILAHETYLAKRNESISNIRPNQQIIKKTA